MFTQLHGHSTYSMLEWIGSISSIVDKAKNLGMTSIAVTDYFGMYGAIDFFRAATAADIKPIFWVELWFVESLKAVHASHTVGTIVLLAENMDGYHNLLNAVSFACENEVSETPCLDFSALQEFSTGIICFMGGDKSFLWQEILAGVSSDEILETIRKFRDILWEQSFWGEIIAQNTEEQLKKVNNYIMDLHTKGTLPALVSSNYHYINAEDKEAYELALAIKDGYKMYDDERRTVTWTYHIASQQEVSSCLDAYDWSSEQIQKLFEHTRIIADRCNVSLSLYQSLFPLYESPQTIQDMYASHGESLVDDME